MADSAGSVVTARHQQRIDELCAASIRALSGQAGLHYRGRRLYRNSRPLPPFAPHLNPRPEVDDFSSFRGAADGMALRLKHSNADLHQQLKPSDPVRRMLFEVFEQFRVEALTPADMPGVTQNLRHRFEAWSIAFYDSGLTETAKGMLLYTVLQITRSRVTAQQVVEATEDAIESTRMSVVPRLGHDLAGLRRQRHDQKAYAEHALAIATLVFDLLATYDLEASSDEGGVDAEKDRNHDGFSLFMELDGDTGDDAFPAASGGASRTLTESDGIYRIFTTAYDAELQAASLVRAAVLAQYRIHLDTCIAQRGLSVSRLARELNAVLASPVRDGWLQDQEEGYIDGARLSQLITSPAERRLFRLERYVPVSQSAVSFLIDCSGSMRQHMESVAILVDIMTRALDQIGVLTEILGFTTQSWNGGRAHKEWLSAGRPSSPGRLNELAHLVFKDSDTSWRQARPAIGALMEGRLFREGVDGEALAWAAQRLVNRHEGRRLLLVISDGSPTDSATALTNDAYYLDHHLCQVVATLQTQADVEIYGVGVGLDLSNYYRQNHVLDLSNSVTHSVLREIVDLIAAGPRA